MNIPERAKTAVVVSIEAALCTAAAVGYLLLLSSGQDHFLSSYWRGFFGPLGAIAVWWWTAGQLDRFSLSRWQVKPGGKRKAVEILRGRYAVSIVLMGRWGVDRRRRKASK